MLILKGKITHPQIRTPVHIGPGMANEEGRISHFSEYQYVLDSHDILFDLDRGLAKDDGDDLHG